MENRRSSQVLAVALGSAALVALAVLSPRVLPYNMDEFVHYHALGCATAPLTRDLPSFRDGCGLYDLRLPFTRTWLPFRSYYYIGSVPSAVFFPFWRLLGDPVAARVQGAFLYVVFVLLTARLLRVPAGLVLLAGLVFPVFTVAFLADQGPVGLSAVLLLVALLAVRRSLASQDSRAAVGWAAGAGLVCFVGLWVKLIFAWWLPAVALFTIAEGRRHLGEDPTAWPRLRSALLAGMLALLVPTLVLLTSVDVDGRAYGAALARSRVSAEPADVGAGAGRLARYFTNASLLAPRNVTLPSSALDGLPAALGALLLVAALSRPGPRRRRVAGWLGVGLLTFGLASTSGFTQWPHHFVFPAVFVVAALSHSLEGGGRWSRAVAVAVVVVVGVSLALRWPDAVSPRDSSPAKDDLLSRVWESGVDGDTLQVHASWGTYYQALLFGDPKRMVVFVKGISDDGPQLQEVAGLARDRGRRVLLISSRRWPRLQTDLVDRVLGRPARTWRFGDWWAVWYETEGVQGSGPEVGTPGDDDGADTR